MANEMKLCRILYYPSLKICSDKHSLLLKSWNFYKPTQGCMLFFSSFNSLERIPCSQKSFCQYVAVTAFGIFMLWLNSCRTAGIKHHTSEEYRNSWWRTSCESLESPDAPLYIISIAEFSINTFIYHFHGVFSFPQNHNLCKISV